LVFIALVSVLAYSIKRQIRANKFTILRNFIRICGCKIIFAFRFQI